MNVSFFDMQDAGNSLNGQVFNNRHALLQAIENMRDRPPFCATLEAENGFALTIGIGKQAGWAQHAPANGDPPYLVAMIAGGTPGRRSDTREVEFLAGDTPTPVSEEFRLSVAELDEIIAHFVETGKRLPALEWKEI